MRLAPLTLLAACTAAAEPAIAPPGPSPSGGAAAVAPSGILAIEKTEWKIDPGDTFLSQYAPDCLWAPKRVCVPGEHCGPPVPVHVACPDPAAPQGKETWFAMPSHFRHKTESTCEFEESRLCPQPKLGGGACTVAETLTVACRPAPGRPGHTLVTAFVHHDGAGRCYRVEEQVCEDGDCDKLVGLLVPC